jgi:hypothetical protein
MRPLVNKNLVHLDYFTLDRLVHCVQHAYMCNCISYNRPDLCSPDGKPEVILPKPAWSSKEQGICVDACIADAIKMLWANDVVTGGCCCGHNKWNPSVIVDSAADAHKALNLLVAFDGRPWDVLQWRLRKISHDNREWRDDK